MKNRITVKILFLLFFFHGIYGYGQNRFVNFEFTSDTNAICQDKTLGVIATIILDAGQYKSFEWKQAGGVFKKVQNEYASVNTAQPGEKKLLFSLILNSGKYLDTVITVKVLPKPIVSIRQSDDKISPNGTIGTNFNSYTWIYNGNLISDYDNRPISNPPTGLYKVMVRDSNGCVGISDVYQVK